MMRDLEKAYLALGLFLGVLFFMNLGSYGLLEDNEARFLEMSWEMKESGDLVVPRLNYIAHFHKPPVTFWIESLSLKLFGDNETAARLPVVLAGLATLFLAAGFLEKGRSKILVAIVLSCNPEFWLLSRTVLTDMFLALSVTLCLYCAWHLQQKRDSRTAGVFWISAATSTLIKGPVGLIVVGLALLSYHISQRGVARPNWSNLQPGRGFPLFLAVTLPWYIAVCIRYPELFRYLLEFQTVQRVATEVHGRGGPFWFYLPVIFVGFLPWCLFLPSALIRAFKSNHPLDRFLLCWLLAPLLLFSLSGSKLPTYILPLYPALALLTTRHLEKKADLRRANLVLGLFLLILLISISVFWFHGVPTELAPASTVILMAGLVCGLFSAIGFVVAASGRQTLAAGVLGVGFGCFLLTLSFGLSACEGSYSARRIADFIRPRMSSDTVVAELSDHLHGLPFYLKRRIVQIDYPRETQFDSEQWVKPYLYSNLEDFLEQVGRSKRIILVMRDSDYEATRFRGWDVLTEGRWLVLERPKSQIAQKI